MLTKNALNRELIRLLSLSLLCPFLYSITFLLQFLIFHLGRRGRNLATLRNTRTMLNVRKPSTRKRRHCGYDLILILYTVLSCMCSCFLVLFIDCFFYCVVSQILREKAANRNQDEFYFKMIRTRTEDGVHRPE